jgi:Flp pilus assembly protein protease CpaA
MLVWLDALVFWLLLLYAMLIAGDLILKARDSGPGLGLVVPNSLVLAVILAVAAKLVILQPPAAIVTQHFAILIGGFVLTFLLFVKGLLGGGVAKLLPAVLAFLGPAALLPTVACFFGIIACGAIAALVVRKVAGSETRG